VLSRQAALAEVLLLLLLALTQSALLLFPLHLYALVYVLCRLMCCPARLRLQRCCSTG
jgi:hypothetical protein